MSAGKVVLGVIAGAATGALLGILFAPARGGVIRRSIYRKGERKMDALKDKFSDVVDSITERFDKVKEDVADLIHDAELKAEKVEKELMVSKK